MPSVDTTEQDQPQNATHSNKPPDTEPFGVSPSGSETGSLAMCGPSLRPKSTCDWGSCSNLATQARGWNGQWLPVCDRCATAPE